MVTETTTWPWADATAVVPGVEVRRRLPQHPDRRDGVHEVGVVADQRGCPTYVGHLAEATRALVDRGSAFGIWHLAAAGDCTWADFAEAIFDEAGLACRVRRITTEEYGTRAPRPAISVLRSARGAPELPHWRDGLRACLAALDVTG